AHQITLYRQGTKTPFNYSDLVGQHIKELTGDPSVQAVIESSEKASCQRVTFFVRDESGHQYEIITSPTSTIASVKQTVAKMMGGDVTPEELTLLSPNINHRILDQNETIGQSLHLISQEGKE